MPQISALATGLGVRAENLFISLARAAFLRLTPYQWSRDPDATKIFIVPDDSDLELDRLPQIRVAVGDMSELSGASINGLRLDTINNPQYRLVDQAYVMFSIYAGNSVEARDLADYVKNTLFHAKSDLGRAGIFGLRNLGAAQPKAMEKGATTDAISMATVTSAFYAARKVNIVEEDGPLWNRVTTRTVDIPTDITLVSNDGFAAEPPVYVEHAMRGSRIIEVTFSDAVGPLRPGGFSVEDESGAVPLLAQRHTTKHDRLQLLLERDLVGAATATYSGTGLYDFLEEALVETFVFEV